MGLYFRKKIMNLPFGGRLTFSSGGLSLSFGKKNARIHFNSKGTYVDTRIPHTDIRVGTKLKANSTPTEDKVDAEAPVQEPAKGNSCGCGCMIITVLILAAIGCVINLVESIKTGDDVSSHIIACVIVFAILLYIFARAQNKKGRQ